MYPVLLSIWPHDPQHNNKQRRQSVHGLSKTRHFTKCAGPIAEEQHDNMGVCCSTCMEHAPKATLPPRRLSAASSSPPQTAGGGTAACARSSPRAPWTSCAQVEGALQARSQRAAQRPATPRSSSSKLILRGAKIRTQKGERACEHWTCLPPPHA